TYTISGFVLFPDYNLALFSRELIIDNKSQTFALVTDNEFESLDENVSFEIGGVYQDGYTEEMFQTDVLDTYHDNTDISFVSNIVLTINNLRSGGIYSDIEAGKVQGIFMSLLIASIGLMIVGIMVSRVLHSQRGPIGILKSMGYTNNQIARPYILLIALMALPAILIGYYLGFIMAEPLKQVFLNFYLLPSKAIEQSLATITVAVIVPFTFIVGLSYLIVLRLLNQKPVTLLNPEVNSNANFLTRRMGGLFKNLKITSKLQHLLLYRSFVKLIVFLVGMFFAAFLILLSFSMTGLFQRVLYDYYEETNYNYVGYCDYTGTCVVPDGAEAVIEIPDVSVDNNDLILYGISPDSYMIPLKDKSGDEITSMLVDGVIIS
ncbi:MAG TPA: ABC transporter permease, partial [Bacillota bacterium]|nr:ABC transporter permease [Bacillota bacterium]